MNKILNKFLVGLLFVLGVIIAPTYADAVDCLGVPTGPSNTTWYYSGSNCTGIPFAFNLPNGVWQNNGLLGYTTQGDKTWYGIASSRWGSTCTNFAARDQANLYEVHACTQVVAPTVTVTASPSTVVYGGGSTISWTSTGATSCSESGGRGGTGTTGSFYVSSLSSNTTFNVTCMLAPSFITTYNAGTAGSTRTQVFIIGPSVEAGDIFSLTVYSHTTSVTAVSGDTPLSIANKLRDAINATTAVQWNDHGSAPAGGTPGFKPAAVVDRALILTLNYQNQFSAWVSR